LIAADGTAPRMAAIMNEPRLSRSRAAVNVPINAIEDTAYSLRRAGTAAGRIAVFGAAQGMETSQTAIKLARALAEDSRVVLVGLASGATAIRGVSSEPSAGGLAELARGAASFADVITKDRLSPLHLISAGRMPIDRIDLLAAPGMVTNFDALAQSYDHVVVDAGSIMGPEIERIAEVAPYAVLVAETSANAAAITARDRLLASGFGDVTMLSAGQGSGETAAAA
jgi:polysaccharide biosynthesis transport protein